ncbi:hypothetical protein HDV02_001763 [Globomyces sp. JEL0801]|nr:hypothetical protein HDV02_001763 [Globomyces sp. JEL0801]
MVNRTPIGPALPNKTNNAKSEVGISNTILKDLIVKNCENERTVTIGPSIPDKQESITKVIGPSMPSKSSIGPTLPPKQVAGPTLPNRYSIGPSMPSKSSIGPTLPPKQVAGPTLPSGNSIGPSMPSKSSIGPTLPPKQIVGPTLPSGNDIGIAKTGPMKVPVGPTMPNRPTVSPTMPSGFIRPRVKSDEEDDFGPKPLVGVSEEIILEYDRLQKIAMIESRINDYKPPKPKTDSNTKKRDEWMLIPPKPTKTSLGDMKARSFSRKSNDIDTDQSLWTEMPEEREKRLNSNASHRPKSLLEQHQESLAQNMMDSDLPPKRFDRERDIVGARMDSNKKEKLINDSKNLDSKFSRGKYI